ncbi:hypothetical protein KKF82_08305 [Patescibacteria group bacterium]|nr:hypothetical protein [Patescibacteria group bacterium]
MKVEVVKLRELNKITVRSQKYAELVLKQQNLAEGEVLKVQVDTQSQVSAIHQLFKRRGIKITQRTLNGKKVIFIPKK